MSYYLVHHSWQGLLHGGLSWLALCYYTWLKRTYCHAELATLTVRLHKALYLTCLHRAEQLTQIEKQKNSWKPVQPLRCMSPQGWQNSHCLYNSSTGRLCDGGGGGGEGPDVLDAGGGGGGDFCVTTGDGEELLHVDESA